MASILAVLCQCLEASTFEKRLAELEALLTAVQDFIFLALQKAMNLSGSSITGLMIMPPRLAFATWLFASCSHRS
jgi:hypothetical protein